MNDNSPARYKINDLEDVEMHPTIESDPGYGSFVDEMKYEGTEPIGNYIIDNSCSISNTYINYSLYKNTELGINLIGLSQFLIDDQAKLWACIKNLVDNNVKWYITFNKQGRYVEITDIEQELFNLMCTVPTCNFYSLPIEDFTPPSIPILNRLWDILDEYHQYLKYSDPTVKCILHCTAGFGRTGTMILSYIIYRKVVQEPEIQYQNIKHIIDTIKIISTKEEYMELISSNSLLNYALTEIGANYSIEAYNEIIGSSLELLSVRIKNITYALVQRFN